MSDTPDATAFADTVIAALADTPAAEGEGGTGRAADALAHAAGTPERYHVHGVLGEGGMGRVLDATDAWFGRKVALKEILVEHAPASLLRRFMIEAIVTGNLEHPGIVAVHERGLRDGRPYYVMRKLDGRTLARALGEAKTLKQRLALLPAVVRVAHTIAFAHDRGVIHRDLKPDNVILGTHGEVTVIDWGIARIRKLDRLMLEPGDVAIVSDLAKEPQTMLGAVVGTPAYMAPEQAASKLDAVDERTDVFALGALLYHVLSGRPPYDGPTALVQMTKALAVDFPEVASLERRVPPALAEICARAMAKEPSDRFRSAAELAEELERALTDAVTAKGSSFVNLLALVVSAVSLISALIWTEQIWMAGPAWRELGSGVYMTVATGALGLVTGAIEFATRGRYKLGPLVVAFTVLTFLGGLLATLLGVQSTLDFMAKHPDVSPSATLRGGLHESLGNATLGGALGGLQLLVWAIGRRRVEQREAPSRPSIDA